MTWESLLKVPSSLLLLPIIVIIIIRIIRGEKIELHKGYTHNNCTSSFWRGVQVRRETSLNSLKMIERHKISLREKVVKFKMRTAMEQKKQVEDWATTTGDVSCVLFLSLHFPVRVTITDVYLSDVPVVFISRVFLRQRHAKWAWCVCHSSPTCQFVVLSSFSSSTTTCWIFNYYPLPSR